MKVVKSDIKWVPFKSLNSGDVFLYKGEVYMKVDVPNYGKHGVENYDKIAVLLENGGVFRNIEGDVLKVEATLSYEV